MLHIFKLAFSKRQSLTRLAQQTCISEDQKYQGALYKEKPGKQKKVNIVEPHEQRRQPYVEDAPEDVQRHDNSAAVALVNAPPRAPSPPPSATFAKPNVFDFLVNDDTPNASKVSLPSAEPMQMVAHAPAIFRSHSNSPSSSQDGHHDQKMIGYDDSLVSNGFAYGQGPIPARKERDLYRTPGPKESRKRLDSPSRYAPEVVTSSMRKSTDKKRKRQVEDLDLVKVNQYATGQMDLDPSDPNFEAPPLQHSGLTGGLTRMLSKSGRDHFLPSPAYSNGRTSDQSDVEETPLNATKQRRDRDRRREKDRDSDAKTEARRGRPSATSTVGTHGGALVKIKKSRRTSDESRPRKHHRSHKHRSDEHPDRERTRRSSGEGGERRRKLKAIEYNVDKGSQSDDDYEDVDDDNRNHGNGQMVVYGDKSKAEMFLSFVNKGPDSEKGCSVNKALKRYHRERLAGDALRKEERAQDKMDDEKELWKSLRLRRNDRGEIVLFLTNGEED